MPALPALPIPHAFWVVPGRLLAGQYPGARDPVAAQARIRAFLATGISVFLDLTGPADRLEPYASVLAAEAAALALPARHLAMTIRDLGVPSAGGMTQILDAIDGGLAQGETIYVHCWGGIGRTGTVVGCYLARHGQCGEAALAALAALRRGWPDGRPAPETEAQRQMVRAWPAGA